MNVNVIFFFWPFYVKHLLKTLYYSSVPCNVEPSIVSNCKAAVQMFYYNAKTMSCAEFTYGGCLASPNMFGSKEDCEKTCLE